MEKGVTQIYGNLGYKLCLCSGYACAQSPCRKYGRWNHLMPVFLSMLSNPTLPNIKLHWDNKKKLVYVFIITFHWPSSITQLIFYSLMTNSVHTKRGCHRQGISAFFYFVPLRHKLFKNPAFTVLHSRMQERN